MSQYILESNRELKDASSFQGMVMCFIAVLVAVVFLSFPTYANTLFVAKNGGDFSVIQDAINVAAEGDTIKIGPGRFSEYQTYVFTEPEWFVYANVTVENLTFIGAGEGVTIIGPADPNTWVPGDNSIGVLYGADVSEGNITVSSLTVENIINGIYVDRGRFDVTGVRFVRDRFGLIVWVGGNVENCVFDDIPKIAVASFSPASILNVSNSVFNRCREGFYFNLTADVSLTNCVFNECISLGQFDMCSGEMTNCQAPLLTGTGVAVYGPGPMLIKNNFVEGGLISLKAGNGANSLVCEGNVFSESTLSAVYIVSCTPTLKNNHILSGDGSLVEIVGFDGPQQVHIDMTENFWGISDRDSIAGLIEDGNDGVPPTTYGIVDFEPYSDVPVSAKKQSMGSLKAMFR
jgi:hypothetical protein